MPGLLDNQAGTPTLSGAVSNDQQYANCFTVSETTVFHRVDWYAVTNDVANAPASIRLWRADTSTQVQAITTIPQQAGPGWQSIQLGDPITCSPGIEYRLGWHASNGRKVAFWSADPTVEPPAPMAWSTSDKSLQRASATLIPNAGWTGTAAVSLHTDDAPTNNPPPSQPPNNTVLPITADLEWWLHTATTNPDSAPKWLYDWWSVDRAVLTAARDAIDAWNTRAGVLFGTSGSLLGGLLAARLDQLLATMDAVDAAIAELGTPAQVSDVTAVGEALADLAVDVGDIRNTTPWPGTGWAKTAETTFEGCLAWDQQADLYVVGFTAIPDNVGTTEACGVTLYHRLAWASEKNGDHIGERRYIEFQNALVENHGRRMNGLLLVAKPLTEGTVEAWQINP